MFGLSNLSDRATQLLGSVEANDSARAETILQLMDSHIRGNPSKTAEFEAIAEDAIESGRSLNDTKYAMLAADRGSGPRATFARKSGEPGGAAMLEAGLLQHMGIGQRFIAKEYGERTADAITQRQNRLTGIQDLMRRFLAAHGAHVPSGKFHDSDIMTAFKLDRSLPTMMAGGTQSTISLSGILGNAANKSLETVSKPL